MESVHFEWLIESSIYWWVACSCHADCFTSNFDMLSSLYIVKGMVNFTAVGTLSYKYAWEVC